MLTKLAIALAFSSDRRARLRQFTIFFTAFIAMTMYCFSLAVYNVAGTIEDIRDNRGYMPASSIETATFTISSKSIIEGGQQFNILTIATTPANHNNPKAVPPGLKELPKEGAAVLSPGLKSKGFRGEDFGFHSSPSGTGEDGSIGPEFLATSTENIIIARVSLPPTLTPQHRLGADISSFGPAGLDWETTTPPFMSQNDAVLLAGLFLVLPTLIVSLLSARAGSPLLLERVRVLEILGCKRNDTETVVRAEIFALSLAGAVLGTIVWTLTAPILTRVSVAHVVVYPSAFEVSFPQLIGCFLLTILMPQATRFGFLFKKKKRKSSKAIVLPQLRLSVYLCGCLLVIASSWLPNRSTLVIVFLFGGLILMSLGIILFAPQLTYHIGDFLSRSQKAASFLAGARMKDRGVSVARPASLIGMTMLLCVSLSSIIAAVEVGSAGQVQALTYAIDSGGKNLKIRELSQKYPGAQFFDVVTQGKGTTQKTYIELLRCKDIRAAHRTQNLCLSDENLPALRSFFTSQNLPTQFRPLSLEKIVNSGITIIPPEATKESAVYKRFAPQFGLYVSANGFPGDYSGNNGSWYRLIQLLGFLIMIIAFTREIYEKSLQELADDVPLDLLGFSSESQQRIQQIALLLPSAAAMAMGLLSGALFIYYGTSGEITKSNFDQFSLITIAVALISLFLISALTRAAKTMPTQRSASAR